MSYIFPSGTKRNILADSKGFDFEKLKDKDEGKEEKKDDKKDEECKDKDEECKEEKKEETKEVATDKDVADENKDAVVEDKDFALDSIKDLPGVGDRATALLDEIKGKVEEVSAVIQESVGETDGAKAKVEEIAAIVKDIKETPAEVDEVEIEIEDEKKTPEEIEINVEKDGDVSIPGVEEKPVEEVEINIGEEVGPENIVKEGKEGCPECGKETCVCAKSKGEFVRLAKLSPKNKEAVREYWLGLGFPQDYVDAMVRDY